MDKKASEIQEHKRRNEKERRGERRHIGNASPITESRSAAKVASTSLLLAVALAS